MESFLGAHDSSVRMYVYTYVCIDVCIKTGVSGVQILSPLLRSR